MKKWKCSVCGYIHQGEEPPEKCPVCGADRSQFVLLEEESATDTSTTPTQPVSEQSQQLPTTPSPTEDQIDTTTHSTGTAKRATIAKLMARYHAHPIAVHIPNGLLPVTIFFTLIAVLFASSTMAITATYNMTVVCLNMPIVVLTGLIDWRHRFKGKITRVFLIKMICAAIVTIISLILTLWWFFQPNIYMDASLKVWLFLLLNLLDLAAAAVAGFFGGKLVFRDN